MATHITNKMTSRATRSAKKDRIKKIKNVSKSEKTILTPSDFDKRYEVVENLACGNCLFGSISFLINKLAREDTTKLTHEDVRKLVSSFYREFDRDIKYTEGTIENAVLLGLLFDNDDEDEDGEHIPHDRNIENDKVWGSITDLLVCSLLFDVNVCLYKRARVTDFIWVEKIKYQYQNEDSISVLYTGNHFEAIYLR